MSLYIQPRSSEPSLYLVAPCSSDMTTRIYPRHTYPLHLARCVEMPDFSDAGEQDTP